MNKEVMILTGAGQIGMAIARRMGYGKKIVVGDRNLKSAEAVCRTLNEAGFDAMGVCHNSPFLFLCWPTYKVKSKKIVLYKIKLFLCKVTRFKRYYK